MSLLFGHHGRAERQVFTLAPSALSPFVRVFAYYTLLEGTSDRLGQMLRGIRYGEDSDGGPAPVPQP